LKTLGVFCKFLFFLTTRVSVVNKAFEFFSSLAPRNVNRHSKSRSSFVNRQSSIVN